MLKVWGPDKEDQLRRQRDIFLSQVPEMSESRLRRASSPSTNFLQKLVLGLIRAYNLRSFRVA